LDWTEFTYEQVKNHFIFKGAKLLSNNYKNGNSKLEYECKCGRIKKVAFKNFYRGSGNCFNCTKANISEIKLFFQKNGCALLSKEYSSKEKLEYVCSCGNRSKALWGNFKHHPRCLLCRNKRVNRFKLVGIEKSKEIFKNHGWVLLEKEYKNNQTKMAAICPCGKPHKISLDVVKRGVLCPKCGYQKTSKKLKGINHYKYRSDLSLEDRLNKRSSPELKNWKTKVKNVMGSFCFLCGSKQKIEVHHLEPYRDRKDLRVSLLNGVPLCQTHHIGFHKEYGTTGFSSKDFIKYCSKLKISMGNSVLLENIKTLNSH
jgi:hypothetical protein